MGLNLKVKARVHKPKPTNSLAVSVLQLDGTTVVAGPVTIPATDPDDMTPFRNVFTVPGPGWYLVHMELFDGTTSVLTCTKARKKK
jgi:hypothetical protein